MTGARAKLEKTVKNASETKKTTISADVVAKLVQEAGTSDITITQTTKNASGKVMNSVSVNAKDLQAGKKLTLVKVDKKTPLPGRDPGDRRHHPERVPEVYREGRRPGAPVPAGAGG